MLKAIHICNSHKPTHKAEIAKEYGLPTQRSRESQQRTIYKTEYSEDKRNRNWLSKKICQN